MSEGINQLANEIAHSRGTQIATGVGTAAAGGATILEWLPVVIGLISMGLGILLTIYSFVLANRDDKRKATTGALEDELVRSELARSRLQTEALTRQLAGDENRRLSDKAV